MARVRAACSASDAENAMTLQASSYGTKPQDARARERCIISFGHRHSIVHLHGEILPEEQLAGT